MADRWFEEKFQKQQVRKPVARKRKGMSATLMLVIANVSIFLIGLILFFINQDIFAKIFFLTPSQILQGKSLWTIITHMFMHSPTSIFHLLFNMITLFFLGSFTERLIGRKRFFIFYIIAGIFAALVFIFLSLFFGNSYFLGTGLDWPAVGASGAIFGVAGLMTVLAPNIKLYIMLIPIPIKAKYAVPGLIIVVAFISAAAQWPIGNAAHFGGFIVGLAYGFYLRIKHKKKVQALDKYFSKY